MINQRYSGLVDASHSSQPEEHIREFAQALKGGLAQDQKSIPCRFLYDARGSQLFEQITRLPEYYPTRTEMAILEDVADQFLGIDEQEVVLVEFGSGSSKKTEVVLERLVPRVNSYVAIEISQAALSEALDRISVRFPDLETRGVVENFHHHARLPRELTEQPGLGFFPGSTIGNCSGQQAVELLTRMRETLGNDARLIVGTDLAKSPDVLLPAYDDAAGVTAEFSKNLLERANRELGATFQTNAFEHLAHWNPDASRIEIYLVSKEEQETFVGGRRYEFEKGERIHIENSHKYSIDGFQELAAQAGWQIQDCWTDDQDWFAVHQLVAPGRTQQ